MHVLQQIPPLLTQGGEIAADATQDLDAHLGAQAARDFLLHFEHAQISLRLVVIKRHGEVGREGEYLPLARLQPIEQGAGWMLLAPSGARGGGWRRVVNFANGCPK